MNGWPGQEAAAVMPHNIEAEQGLLGALMIDNRRLEDAAERVAAVDFYLPVHARLFEAICSFIEGGRVASPISLKNHFEGDEALKKVGGAEYLADLAAACVSVLNAGDYADTVRECARRRTLIELGERTALAARDFSLEPKAAAVIEDTEQALFALAEEQEPGGPVLMTESVHDTVAFIETAQRGDRAGLRTGLAALDDMNNGFFPGDLVTLAGRPSMGKTVAALTMAHNMAESGAPVLFFSLEMSRDQLNQRLFARYTGLPTGMQTRPGALAAGHFHDLTAAAAKLAALPLAVDDSGGLSAHQIRARARRFKRRHGLGCILIDYLNLMTFSDSYRNKVDQIGEVTRALKNMAKDLAVPVILLGQLNRDVEKREDKRPHLSDLRDSGAIEEHSDAVIFLYREQYYLERGGEPPQKENESDAKYAERKDRWFRRCEDARGKVDFIIAKWRQGAIGDVRLQIDLKRQVIFGEEQEAR